MKFLENHQKYMQGLTNGHGHIPQQRQLGYEQRQEDPPRRHEETRRVVEPKLNQDTRQDYRPQVGSRG